MTKHRMVLFVKYVTPNAKKFYLNIIGIMTDLQSLDQYIMAFESEQLIFICYVLYTEIIVSKTNEK